MRDARQTKQSCVPTAAQERCLDGIFIASKMLVRQSLQKEGALLTTSDKKNVVQSQLSEKPQHRGKV
jgi:hypothetical protein